MFTLNSKMNNSKKAAKLLLVSTFAVALSACGDSDNDDPVVTPEPPAPAEYSYRVTVTNLTYAQPLSPFAVLLHGDTKMWMLGDSASVPLEELAEGGDSTNLLAENNVLVSAADDGVLMPGNSSSVTISTTDRTATHLTSATMLVNTNDAFSGLTGIDISAMAVDESLTWRLNVYDAGTEANSEAAGTIPGPADGGTGFDAARDDVDFIAYHPGVVSQDDGLTNSVLTQAHRFDNPAIKLTITRTK